MGYYSTVAIRCQKNAYEMFKEAYEKNEFAPDKVLTAPDDDGQYLSEQYLIMWDWIKWYSSYDKIAEIEKVMDRLDKEVDAYDDAYGYRFVRVGEDTGDVEYRENCYEIELYADTIIDIDDFVKDKNKVVSDEMYDELAKLLDYFDIADADDVSDGELLDMFYGFCKKLKNDIDEER